MSGRGKARPTSRAAQEPATGGTRRSTRQQQPSAQPDEPQLASESLEQPEQEDESSSQADAEIARSAYQQVIDPAIAGPQDGSMPPPLLPIAKSPRAQAETLVARRATRGGGSVRSIRSVYSSQPEPLGSTQPGPAPSHAFGTPARHTSVLVSSAITESPSQRVAKSKLMSVMLPRLFNAADDLCEHLFSDQEDEEAWEFERIGFKEALDAYRGHYVEESGDPVVDPVLVADTVQPDRTSPQWSRAFKIASTANLATLLNDITVADSKQFLPLLAGWNLTFPGSFLGVSPDVFPTMVDRTAVQQALMIRTQLSIATLQALQEAGSASFHPWQEVANIWCRGDVSVDSVEAFLGGNKDALQLHPIERDTSEGTAIQDQFAAICSALPNQVVEGGLDLSQLQEKFPFSEFVYNLRAFVRERLTGIKTLFQHEAGYPSAASATDSQIRSQLEGDSISQSFDRAGQEYNLTSLRMMKQLEQQGTPGYPSHPLSQDSYSPAPRIPYPPGFGSPSVEPNYPNPPQQGGVQASGHAFAASAAQVAGDKRRATDDPNMDGASSATPRPKKPRAKRTKKNAGAEAAQVSSSAAAPETGSLASSQYPLPPGADNTPDFEALSRRSRELTAAARKAKAPQVRQAWVRRDIALLVKAVDTYQCKWSTIEKEITAGTIPFEHRRDQQALRDKARLLKQDFLKADVLLPRGFDLVVLGKKEREAVKAVGKNPDRREADVVNDQPVNTEYVDKDATANPAPAPAPLPPADANPEEQLQLTQAEPQPQPQAEGEGQPQPQPEPQAQAQTEVPAEAQVAA
ncbi:hypothetical protein B0J18DRAFT_393415 [Chaetomium sp. MPI-SDFR-AT-0129]|nr:hypothetical protein B0J18DRAFT_393415 [Chaetomium sp. MPI-SDFR-AT-0129]